MRLFIFLTLAFLITFSQGCVPSAPTEPVEPEAPPLVDCTMVSETIQLQYSYIDANKVRRKGTYSQVMPVTKPMAHEAHYIVPGLDPEELVTQTDRIGPHLQRTCDQLLRDKWAIFYPNLSLDCSEVYRGSGATEWTPPEPTRGHGTRPYPGVECEAATGNMYWAKGASPKPGTKFLASKGNKYFVLCMGYEAGPGSPEMGGGLSTEALYYLGGKHRSVLTLGRAFDQSIPYGPVTCK